MNRTSTALFLMYLLCTQGYFDKTHAMISQNISYRTFCRAVAEIKALLLDFNIPKELLFNKKTCRYELVDAFDCMSM